MRPTARANRSCARIRSSTRWTQNHVRDIFLLFTLCLGRLGDIVGKRKRENRADDKHAVTCNGAKYDGALISHRGPTNAGEHQTQQCRKP